MRCSQRRKTKQPYCNDDPDCYWDKYCKRKTQKNATNDAVIKNKQTLELILEKLSNIENKLESMNKKPNMNSPMLSFISRNNNSNASNKLYNNNANSPLNNKTRKNKTASLRGINNVVKRTNNFNN